LVSTVATDYLQGFIDELVEKHQEMIKRTDNDNVKVKSKLGIVVDEHPRVIFHIFSGNGFYNFVYFFHLLEERKEKERDARKKDAIQTLRNAVYGTIIDSSPANIDPGKQEQQRSTD